MSDYNLLTLDQLIKENQRLSDVIDKLEKHNIKLENEWKLNSGYLRDYNKSMNPHRKYKSYMQASDLWLINAPIIWVVVLFTIFCLNPLHKKNTEKLSKPKPIDRQKITSIEVTGNVESIHPWGRTEVVPIKEIELEYFEYCDEWVMSGDVVQPVGRNGYFMPVLKGHLDLNVKYMTQTLIDYGSYATGPEKDAETYEDFRMAHVKVKSGKVVNIKYSHYRLDQNKTWSIIASWEARFNENF